MVCRLIDFAVLVLRLLMFKFHRIIGISKIESFNFSVSERVKEHKQNKKKRTFQNALIV